MLLPLRANQHGGARTPLISRLGPGVLTSMAGPIFFPDPQAGYSLPVGPGVPLDSSPEGHWLRDPASIAPGAPRILLVRHDTAHMVICTCHHCCESYEKWPAPDKRDVWAGAEGALGVPSGGLHSPQPSSHQADEPACHSLRPLQGWGTLGPAPQGRLSDHPRSCPQNAPHCLPGVTISIQ